MAVFNRVSPDIQTRPHTYSFEQLAFCVEGAFDYHVGDQVFHMTPGAMVRVPPNTVHYV